MDHLGDPTSYLALESGTPVYSASGNQIGVVTHVLAAEHEDVFDGVVIGRHHFGEGHRFVDVDDIDAMYDNGVVLKLDDDACAALPAPSANPAVIRVDPAESESEFRHAKLRRAWDLISGKR
jgi:uncharacterized protein YrrD